MEMVCRVVSAGVLSLVICGVNVNASTGQTAPGNNGVVRQWSRRVAARFTLEAPGKGFITNAKDFALLWRVWQLAGDVPAVDFDKYLILVTTGRSSVLQVRAVQVDEKGDLKTVVVATSDLTSDYAVVITLAEREGVNPAGEIATSPIWLVKASASGSADPYHPAQRCEGVTATNVGWSGVRGIFR